MRGGPGTEGGGGGAVWPGAEMPTRGALHGRCGPCTAWIGGEESWGDGADAIVAACASIAERGAATPVRASKPKELIL